MSTLGLPARRVWQVGQTVNHVWPFSYLPSVISEFKGVNAFLFVFFKAANAYLFFFI